MKPQPCPSRRPRAIAVFAVILAIAALITGCSLLKRDTSLNDLLTEVKTALKANPTGADKSLHKQVRTVSGKVKESETTPVDTRLLYIKLETGSDDVVECTFSDLDDKQAKTQAAALKPGQQVTFTGELDVIGMEEKAVPPHVVIHMDKCKIQ